jgi:hypothetical protein
VRKPRHDAEIISRFISACILASAPEHFSGRLHPSPEESDCLRSHHGV